MSQLQLPDPPKWDPNDYSDIDYDKVAKDDITEYVKWCTTAYEVEKWRDNRLWEAYQVNFANFTEEAFRKASQFYVTKLKNFLRDNGVYVEMSRKVKMTEGLYNAAQEEEQATWPPDELQKEIESGTFNSKLNLTHAQRTLRTTPAPRSTLAPQPSIHASVQPPIQTSAMTSTHLSGFGREVATLSKLYTEESKYGGEGDNFEFKLKIFNNACKKADIPPEGKIDALSIMLKGLALDYFYSNLEDQEHLSFDDVCKSIQNHFEGEEYQRTIQTKWESTNLLSIIKKTEGEGKSTEDCLYLLIKELTHLKHGLDPEFRTDKNFRNKLITACRGIPACEYACYNPADTPSGFINQLKSSISTYEHNHGLGSGITSAIPNTLFTDRRYHKQYGDYQSNQPHNKPRDNPQRNSRGKGNKRCFVCQKENCWSTRHSKEERDEATKQFRNRLHRRFDRNPRQYIAEMEGTDPEARAYDDDTDQDDLQELTEALILNTDMTMDTQEPKSETFFTSIGNFNYDDATNMRITLADRAFEHAITGADSTVDDVDDEKSHSGPLLGFPESDRENQPSSVMTYNPHQGRYSTKEFHGILIDTGAAIRSTAGLGQFLAYNRAQKDNTPIDESKSYTFKFGIGSTSSIGVATINTPVGNISFHIVEADTPFILCLQDMKSLSVYLDNLKNLLVSVTKSQVWPVFEKFGHLFLLWEDNLPTFITSSFNLNPCYLTEAELRQLHRRFGHPTADRLRRLLNRSGHGDELDKQALEYLTKFCDQCQKNGKSPGRFKFVLKDDTIDFNHTILIDVMYIDGSPVLHIVDNATRFQAARWLKNLSARHTWETLRLMWIDIYLGPPDHIVHDAGTNFVSKEFKQYANSLAITTKAVPVEAHWSIGVVERYHPVLKRAYAVIVADIPEIDKNNYGKELALQMAVKAVNDTAGPDGLVPTLLVFGAYPKMSQLDPPAPTIAQRATAVKKAMEEVTKIRATRAVQDALNQRNGPDTSGIHELPIGSEVLVWREGNTGQSGKWTGPHTLLGLDGETCKVQLQGTNGTTDFRSTTIKPYLRPSCDLTQQLDDEDHQPDDQEKVSEPLRRQPQRQRQLPERYRQNVVDLAVFLEDTDITGNPSTVFAYGAPTFSESRNKEINGLLEKGVFKIINRSEIPHGTRIFNSRFVDEIKNSGTNKAFEKSRLVVQAYNDHGKDLVLTQSPTIQRVSQRLILALTAMLKGNGMDLYLRDITQAYTQSTTLLSRDFFVRPPPELGLEEHQILKVIKPLYGIPEAGNHWFNLEGTGLNACSSRTKTISTL